MAAAAAAATTSFSSSSLSSVRPSPHPRPSPSPRANLSCWRSANYATVATKIPLKPAPLKQFPKRAGVIRHATIEDIEAEKSTIENDIKRRMERSIESVRSNFNAVRTNRASPAMLDRVEVEYYGTPVSLKSIAQISNPDSASLVITPFDKSSLKTIEKAIVRASLGFALNNDGEVIRLTLPPLTAERRKDLTKMVNKLAEEGKVAVRNIRRDGIKAYEKLEKEKKLSEDNKRDLCADLQKLTDEYIKKVDAVHKQKEQELLTI